MQMKPDEAAKVLRVLRRASVDDQTIKAIDAAVAALEAVDTITERARDLIGMHLSEQEGMMLPTAKQYQDAVDALAQAIGAPEQSPPCANSRHPRERAMSEDAARGNFRAP